MRGLVTATDIPGLFDVKTEDGGLLTDLTVGQLRYWVDQGNRLDWSQYEPPKDNPRSRSEG